MTISAAITILVLARGIATGTQPPAAPTAQPPAPAVGVRQSLIPKLELRRTTTYSVASKSATSSETTIGTGADKDTTGGTANSEWMTFLRVRPLKTDTRADLTDVEVEFVTFKGTCEDGAGHRAEFDTSKRFTPQPRPRVRPKNGQGDNDRNDYNGIPYDRLIDEYFRKMNGAKTVLRVDPRGRIVSSTGSELLNTPNVGCAGTIAPHSALAWLFGPVSLNNDKASTGLVQEGDHWTHDRVFAGNTKPAGEPVTTITQFTVRLATPARVEIDADGTRQPRASDAPRNTNTQTEKSLFVWDPVAGQLVRATRTIDIGSVYDTAKSKGHFQSHSEMTIERVEPDPTTKPTLVKPAPGSAKPHGTDKPATP